MYFQNYVYMCSNYNKKLTLTVVLRFLKVKSMQQNQTSIKHSTWPCVAQETISSTDLKFALSTQKFLSRMLCFAIKSLAFLKQFYKMCFSPQKSNEEGK